MEHQNSSGRLTKRRILVVVGGIIALACVVIGFIVLTQPERSVASFCRIAKEEKSVLVGDVNYEKRLESYKKLEVVSPDDILSDITTIRKGYESIVQNPSNTVSAGLGMAGAENRRTDYINKNCPDF